MEETKEDVLRRLFYNNPQNIENNIEWIIKNSTIFTGHRQLIAGNLFAIFKANECNALYHYFIEMDKIKMKQAMFRGSRCTQLATDKFDDSLFGVAPLLLTLVSDHKGIINHFAELTYNSAGIQLSYADNVENGIATWSYILQCMIKEDWAEYKRAMTIMQTKGVKRMGKTVLMDIAFMEGLFNRDKQKMEAALKAIVSPRNQSYVRRSGDFVTQFISYNAVCYAKLAWLKGIEVVIDSPLVPKDWLPIEPLKDEEYVDYDFVKKYLG